MSSDSAFEATSPSLTSQYATFILLIVCVQLFFWATKSVIKIKAVIQLWRGVKNDVVVRIDGMSMDVYSINRDHVLTMLRARSKTLNATMDKVALPFHVQKQIKLNKRPNNQGYELVIRAEGHKNFIMDVYLGVYRSAWTSITDSASMQNSGLKASLAGGGLFMKKDACTKIAPFHVNIDECLYQDDDSKEIQEGELQIVVPITREEMKLFFSDPDKDMRYHCVLHCHSSEQRNADPHISEVSILSFARPPRDKNAPKETKQQRGKQIVVNVDSQHLRSEIGYSELQGIYGTEDADCIACTEEPKSVVLLPCRHMSLCNECREMCTTCPVCRADIESFVILYDEEKQPKVANSQASKTTKLFTRRT